MKKQTYEIKGRTKSGKYASTGFCSTIFIAAKMFTAKYPRFKGSARLVTQMAEVLEDNGDSSFLVADASNWETVMIFQSIADLDQYVMGEEAQQRAS